MKKVAGMAEDSRRRSMRGAPTRDPYSPAARATVSWSGSNERATATRAPPGHAGGDRLGPARTRPTAWLTSSTSHSHGRRPAPPPSVSPLMGRHGRACQGHHRGRLDGPPRLVGEVPILGSDVDEGILRSDPVQVRLDPRELA